MISTKLCEVPVGSIIKEEMFHSEGENMLERMVLEEVKKIAPKECWMVTVEVKVGCYMILE